MSQSTTVLSSMLVRREGPAPRTTTHNPQQQLDQIPDAAEYAAFKALFEVWPDVIKRPSLRAPSGTIGLFLPEDEAAGPPYAFLLGTEFAHLHPLPDGSLHMVLPSGAREAAIQLGWGLPHPMAGMPSVSPQTMLIYAPRDAHERAVVTEFVRASERFARGVED